MASTQQLKHRMGSIKNTKQITKAMELVSASKMRRAQDNAFKSRDYRNVALEILTRLRKLTDVSKHPLFDERPVKTRLYVVITSDRTLAGAYNSNILKAFTQELQKDATEGVKSEAVVIGRQVARFTTHLKDLEVVAVYEDFPEQPTANDINPILMTLKERFTGLDADVVDIIYTDFKSSLSQVVTVQRLLPAAFEDVAEPEHDLDEAIFEPSTTAVLDNVTERLIEVQLSQDLLESFASEHSMRMMAMKSASDNASDLIDDLTLAFNTARQASITQEIAEITGGVEAMK